ncbi:MAG: hypothetical protein JO117_07725 [Verrucomicrobia bacterium]|nr:hypothetical protein [Verrucomicrobiota bacterium]MBV9657377.1 hypothetical protein [Verrucomicrobiota bacterium]
MTKSRSRVPFFALLLLAALLLSGGAGCTQTPLQRAQDLYWNAVVDHLDFNAGRPREQIVVVTQTRRASATRIVTDK